MSPEEITEIILVGKAAAMGDLFYCQVAVCQEAFGFFDAHIGDIILDGRSHRSLKPPGELDIG